MLTIADDFPLFLTTFYVPYVGLSVSLLGLSLVPYGSDAKTHAFKISQHGDFSITGRSFLGPNNPT